MFTFKALVESTYSPSFYRELNNKGGIGMKFICLTSLIHAALITFVVFTALNITYKEEINNFVKQVPEITVKDGELSIDKPSPYNMNMGGEGFIIFDTSMKPDEMNVTELVKWMDDNNVFAVVTKKTIVAKKSNNEIRIFDLTDAKENYSFNSDDVQKVVDKSPIYILPLVFLIVFPFYIVYKLIQAILLSVLGLIANKIAGSYLDYNTILRVTAYAMWPGALLVMVLGIANKEVPTWGFIALAFASQIFAFRAIKKG